MVNEMPFQKLNVIESAREYNPIQLNELYELRVEPAHMFVIFLQFLQLLSLFLN
jgi:hypothetical protein